MKTWNKLKRRMLRKLKLMLNERQLRAMMRLGRTIERKKIKQEQEAHGFPVAPRQPGFTQVEIIAPPPQPHTIASYEPPAPTTDGKIQAQGIRKRATTRKLQQQTLQEQKSGKLWQYYRKMPQEESITGMLEKMPPDLEALFEHNNWIK